MLFLVLPLFAAAAFARIMDSVPNVPRGWTFLRAAQPGDTVTLHVAMRQQKPLELEQKVLGVSTPGHADYGKHLSLHEIRSYTAPSDETNAAVNSWIRDLSIKPVVDNNWITFTTTVATANRLLDAAFDWYQHEAGDKPQLRTLSYSVPDKLANHVDMIQPTTRFGQLKSQRSTIFSMERLGKSSPATGVQTLVETSTNGSVTALCGSGITPICLKTLYNVNYTASPVNNSVAFASYLNQYARYKDLQAFQSKYVPKAQGQNFTVVMLNGGKNDQVTDEDSGEANLDIQFLNGISHPIPITEYSTGGLGPLVPTDDQPDEPGSNEPYLEFLQYILAQPDEWLPQTLSTSYGEEEQSVPQDFAMTVCNLFMQLGARGVSVIFSSGDSGPGNSCVDNKNNTTAFEPTFPAGCPWVTAVGSTHLTGPEQAATFSSGGFSNLHAQPGWQASYVRRYLDSIGSTYAPYFNKSGRGIPDVAVQGSNFAVIDQGYASSMSGTSASAPTFAGMVALLNAARQSTGQTSLGFLNPWLYANAAAFTDITRGAGVGCSDNADFEDVGGALWNATDGWDPVTGLGTPLFDRLLAVAAPGVPNA